VGLHPRGARFLRRAWTKWMSILAWCLGSGALREQSVNQ
jgi:hypothetical protein